MATPTADQNHSYAECLRFDRMRFLERGAGRSGFLSADDEAQHIHHATVVARALDAGVEFDRMSFVEAA